MKNRRAFVKSAGAAAALTAAGGIQGPRGAQGEPGPDVPGEVIKQRYEAQADTNALTDFKDDKLSRLPVAFETPAGLLKSTQGPIGVGTIRQAGPHRYEEMASDPQNIFLRTDGEVYLKPLPGDDGKYSAAAFDILNAPDVADRISRAFAVADGSPLVFEKGDYNLEIPAGYDVYLLAGDEWMAGSNAGPIKRAGADSTNPRILQYSYRTFNVIQASLPLQAPVPSSGVSPGLAFAKSILEGHQPNGRFAMPSNRGIILVPASRYFAEGVLAWSEGGTGYNQAVAGINAALAYGSGTNRFMGAIFAGGAADLENPGTTAADVMKSLRPFVTGLQAAYNTEARFVFTKLISEYKGTSVDEGLGEMFTFPYVTIIKGLEGYQEGGILTTAEGSRILGEKFANAFHYSGPTEFTTRFTKIEGERNRAIVRAGANFIPSRPLGVEWSYENSNTPTAYGVRGQLNLREKADYVSTRYSGEQWPGLILPTTDYGFSSEFGFVREPDEWPESPTTTLQGTAIALPEGNTNVAATASLTLGLGSQRLWGHVVVMGNSLDSIHPDGKSDFMCGIEVDIQPAEGSGLSSGVGVLINNFEDPVDFAGCAIVGDAGGAFQDGLFFGNVRRFGIDFGGTFAGTTGIRMTNASFTNAAISMPDGNTNGIEFWNDSITSNIYQTVSGQLRIDGGSRTLITRGVTDKDEISAFAAADGVESFRVFVGSGAVANAADATVKMRANKTTGRSINAGGTINASGADYAEYHVKRSDCGMIAPGDVCGIDANGEITDMFDNAVRFAIKSTNPFGVGKDDWSASLGPKPTLPEYEKPEWARSFAGGDRPIGNTRLSIAEEGPTLPELQSQWDAEYAQWAADKAADRAAFEASQPCLDARAAQDQWEADYEALRQTVDRIAYCGQVPCNVLGGSPGEYLVPKRNADGTIGVTFVPKASMTLPDLLDQIGRVQNIDNDMRPLVVVGIS